MPLLLIIIFMSSIFSCRILRRAIHRAENLNAKHNLDLVDAEHKKIDTLPGTLLAKIDTLAKEINKTKKTNSDGKARVNKVVRDFSAKLPNYTSCDRLRDNIDSIRVKLFMDSTKMNLLEYNIGLTIDALAKIDEEQSLDEAIIKRFKDIDLLYPLNDSITRIQNHHAKEVELLTHYNKKLEQYQIEFQELKKSSALTSRQIKILEANFTLGLLKEWDTRCRFETGEFSAWVTNSSALKRKVKQYSATVDSLSKKYPELQFELIINTLGYADEQSVRDDGDLAKALRAICGDDADLNNCLSHVRSENVKDNLLVVFNRNTQLQFTGCYQGKGTKLPKNIFAQGEDDPNRRVVVIFCHIVAWERR